MRLTDTTLRELEEAVGRVTSLSMGDVQINESTVGEEGKKKKKKKKEKRKKGTTDKIREFDRADSSDHCNRSNTSGCRQWRN